VAAVHKALDAAIAQTKPNRLPSAALWMQRDNDPAAEALSGEINYLPHSVVAVRGQGCGLSKEKRRPPRSDRR